MQTTSHMNDPRSHAARHQASDEDGADGGGGDDLTALIHQLDAEEQLLLTNVRQLEEDKLQQAIDGNFTEVTRLDAMASEAQQSADEHRQIIAALKLGGNQKNVRGRIHDLQITAGKTIAASEHEITVAVTAHADSVAHRHEIVHHDEDKKAQHDSEKSAKKTKPVTVTVVLVKLDHTSKANPPPPSAAHHGQGHYDSFAFAIPGHAALMHEAHTRIAAAHHAAATVWHEMKHAAHAVVKICAQSGSIHSALHLGSKLLHAHPALAKIAHKVSAVMHAMLGQGGKAASALTGFIAQVEETVEHLPKVAFSQPVVEAIRTIHIPFLGPYLAHDPADDVTPSFAFIPGSGLHFSLGN